MSSPDAVPLPPPSFTTTGLPLPVSDGFDLPFYNGYAIDVAVLLAAYALTTYFLTLWPTWVCCVKIPSWRSYRKWLVIAMLFVELMHVVCAFLALDSYRSRETTLGNKKAPAWTLQWTFFTTALAVFTVQATVAYVVHGVCKVPRMVRYAVTASVVGPFVWNFYAIFIQGGHPDLASYASYVSITSTVAAMLGEVATINLLTYYIGRRKSLFNEAFVSVADFVQPALILFLCLRGAPWCLNAVFQLPEVGFPASAMKLGGLEVIGNLYPVLLIVAVNAYEDASPTEVEEYWKDFRLTILTPLVVEVV